MNVLSRLNLDVPCEVSKLRQFDQNGLLFKIIKLNVLQSNSRLIETLKLSDA